MNGIIPTTRDTAAGVLGALSSDRTERSVGQGRDAAKGFAPLLASKLNPRKKVEATSAESEMRREDEAEESRSRKAAEAGAEAAARAAANTAAKAESAATDEAKPTAAAVEAASTEEAEAAAAETRRADVAKVHRSLDRLDAEFRSRFERVVARMQDEFGHKVEVVETFRDQARQDHLFEQGRSQPGPVVTWTRQSNHTRGTAADVIIDGSYDSQLAFTRLAQIAAEEGLRTLGPSDPGHVELTGAGAGRIAETPAAPAHGPVGGLAMPAVPELARVARVASLAVPTVAQVARPGASAPSPVAVQGAREAEIPAAPAPLELITVEPTRESHTATPTVTANGAGIHPGGARSSFGDSSGERRQGAEEQSAQAAQAASAAETSMLAELAAADPTQSLRAPQGIAAVEAPAPVSGADAASRIARVLDIQESLGSLPPTHMLLRVEGANGVEDRIRVDLRGGRVDATLNMGSANEVGALGARVEDLVRALERHGLETDTVRIRSTAGATDTVELGRAAAALGDTDLARAGAARNGAESSFSRDRGEGGHPAPRDDQRPRQDAESQQRSRKQPKGEKPS